MPCQTRPCRDSWVLASFSGAWVPSVCRQRGQTGASASKISGRKRAYPPIMTVTQHGGRIVPVGDGIGATQLACAVMSPARAAGILEIITVADPLLISPGPAGTQGINVQIFVMSVRRAAGILPISTVGAQGDRIGSGSAGCGTGVGVGAGGWIGAWQCGAC